MDYVTLAVLMTLWLIMEDMHPYTRVLYFKTDAQLWRYSYPLRPNTVPPLAVPALAVGGPLVIFIVYYFAFRCSRVEFHNLTLGLLSAVFVTASVVNFVKLNVSVVVWAGGCTQPACFTLLVTTHRLVGHVPILLRDAGHRPSHGLMPMACQTVWAASTVLPRGLKAFQVVWDVYAWMCTRYLAAASHHHHISHRAHSMERIGVGFFGFLLAWEKQGI